MLGDNMNFIILSFLRTRSCIVIQFTDTGQENPNGSAVLEFSVWYPVWYSLSVRCANLHVMCTRKIIYYLSFDPSTNLSQSLWCAVTSQFRICYSRAPETEINRSRSNTGYRFYYFKDFIEHNSVLELLCMKDIVLCFNLTPQPFQKYHFLILNVELIDMT